MHLSREQNNTHTIQAYSETGIKVNDELYYKSIIISPNKIITQWPIHAIHDLNETLMKPILELHPEIIIIGHNQSCQKIPLFILNALSQKGIGFECMSIGAACRTFNVLLSEQRTVTIGLIFST